MDLTKSNLRDFVKSTLMIEENIKKYVKSLVEYIEILEKQNFLGKMVERCANGEIRQLIYRQHKIVYWISEESIEIIASLSTY